MVKGMANDVLETNENKNEFGIIVLISSDGMQASVVLPTSFDEDGKLRRFSQDDIFSALRQKGVVTGIMKDAISEMLDNEMYGVEVVCAKGKNPTDGKDGYYEYMFNDVLDRKPKIREDGTADYWSIHLVELVKKRQVIARYHDPDNGIDGENVYGKVVYAKRGKGQPPLAGTGFKRYDNNHVYVSDVDGKIEYTQKRVIILPVYEIFGDVDIKTGNIDFRGDVIVHGSVRTGMTIKTTGSLTVDGVVEACELNVDKDVLIRGGIQGGYKAIINIKGSLTAGFIEYSTINTDGMIVADSIVNSNVTSYDKIFVNHKSAHIVGGKVYATAGVEVNVLGSKNNVKTQVVVGTSSEIFQEIFSLQAQLTDDKALVAKADSLLSALAEKENNQEKNSNPQMRMDLLRTKVAKQAEISQKTARLEYLNGLIEKGKEARIRINSEIFAGAEVSINNVKTILTSHQDGVEFIESNKNLRMYSLAVEAKKNER